MNNYKNIPKDIQSAMERFLLIANRCIGVLNELDIYIYKRVHDTPLANSSTMWDEYPLNDFEYTDDTVFLTYMGYGDYLIDTIEYLVGFMCPDGEFNGIIRQIVFPDSVEEYYSDMPLTPENIAIINNFDINMSDDELKLYIKMLGL